MAMLILMMVTFRILLTPRTPTAQPIILASLAPVRRFPSSAFGSDRSRIVQIDMFPEILLDTGQMEEVTKDVIVLHKVSVEITPRNCCLFILLAGIKKVTARSNCYHSGKDHFMVHL